MVYKPIIKAYMKRKEKLQYLIDTRELKEERVLKISGAIDEINFFINFLNEYQKNLNINNNDNDLINNIKKLKGINNFN
ncbi:MAG: hypothetical protein ACOC3X_01205 [Nanoarchaeota archaeon]